MVTSLKKREADWRLGITLNMETFPNLLPFKENCYAFFHVLCNIQPQEDLLPD